MQTRKSRLQWVAFPFFLRTFVQHNPVNHVPMPNTDTPRQSKLSNLVCPPDMTLEQWQVALRQQQAARENFDIQQVDEKFNPGEYAVSNPTTRRRYKIIYRGDFSPWNYCSCPDFMTSGLGTCKHVEAVKMWVREHGAVVHHQEPAYTSVYVDYRGRRSIRIRIGEEHRREFTALAQEYFDPAFVLRQDAYPRFDAFLERARAIDDTFRCYPDALNLIIRERSKLIRARILEQEYPDEALDNLLATSLYPYQREGVRFAVKAGRAIIADEMGLGKTIQAIAASEIYIRQGLAESVLVVCPASLKYQWRKEIERFTGGPTAEADEDFYADGRTNPKVVVVEGKAERRRQLYACRAPYKIVSYNAMASDIRQDVPLTADVLVMDEVQRLRNWKSQIRIAARRIESTYSILLSGTPLENKLEELYSIAEFADPHCLAPFYRFRHDYLVVDPQSGRTTGYRNLRALSDKLSGILIRRTRREVLPQLPERTDQYITVPMTPQQARYHEEMRAAVARLIGKWRHQSILSEEDRRRLLSLMQRMRMVADSTFIITQDETEHHDVKVAEAMNIIDSLFVSNEGKVVFFSEWERMGRLLALQLDRCGIRYEFLHGSLSAAKRSELLDRFTADPGCRILISTDTGASGLNLQVASFVVNLDLPWNPATLEQRVSRVYRIGQEMPVQVLCLVSKGSIEESLIEKMRFKSALFEGVLEGGEDSIILGDSRFQRFMEGIAGSIDQSVALPVEDEIDEPEPTPADAPLAAASASETPSASAASLVATITQALHDPEAIRLLAEAIPVEDKQTVTQILTLIGRILKE